MDVAIVGDGVAGSCLYRLLSRARKEGFPLHTLDFFARRNANACGIHPCAWMTHVPDFREMLDYAGLSPDRYLLFPIPWTDFDGYMVRCELATLDKPLLLRDMRGPVPLRYDPVDTDSYDVVVDCTGAARALLPPVSRDRVSPTLQFRVRRPFWQEPPRIRFVRIGYAWSFPLDDTMLHIGIGSLGEDLSDALEETGFLRPDDQVLCQCHSSVRLSAPKGMQPFHRDNVWGVGESIGTVSPLVGDGIVPSLQCARLFAESLVAGSLDRYPDQVLSNFSWMEEERAIIERLVQGATQPRLRDMLLLRRHAHRFGMHIQLGWVLSEILQRKWRVHSG